MIRTILRWGLTSGATGMAIAAASPALCAEGASSPYINGYRNFLTGIVPPQPGVYLRNDWFFYEGDAKAAVIDGRAQAGVRGDIMADFIAPTVVTRGKILGGTYAFGITLALMQADVDAGLRTPDRVFFRNDGKTGLGDMIVSPLILGWHAGNLHTTFSLSAIVPVGRYKSSDLANLGKNYWGFLPQVGVTWFDPKSGWDVSLAASFITTSRNKATDYDTGDLVHIEGAIGKQLGPVKLGVAGYIEQQISDDTGSGAVLGGFRSRVYGVGPAAEYSVKGVSVTLKWATEFGAKDALEGDSVMLTGGFKF